VEKHRTDTLLGLKVLGANSRAVVVLPAVPWITVGERRLRLHAVKRSQPMPVKTAAELAGTCVQLKVSLTASVLLY